MVKAFEPDHWSVSAEDQATVTRLLGRKPMGRFRIVVRDEAGLPVVIENFPLLEDGTPMPTLYWLVHQELIRKIGHLESAGGVDAAETEVSNDELQAVHARYAAKRDAYLRREGDRSIHPSGGVAGTRAGVKCLHAHYANYLAGNEDPIGRWVEAHLRTREDGII